jgi:hypothetical protein
MEDRYLSTVRLLEERGRNMRVVEAMGHLEESDVQGVNGMR